MDAFDSNKSTVNILQYKNQTKVVNILPKLGLSAHVQITKALGESFQILSKKLIL